MKKVVCKKDFLTEDGRIAFIGNRVYNAMFRDNTPENQCYVFEKNETGDRHIISMPTFLEYFKELKILPTYERYKIFEDYENQEIKFMNDQIDTLNNLIKITENKIKEIRDNCNHNYYFSCSGPYSDSYKCIHCGHEIDK